MKLGSGRENRRSRITVRVQHFHMRYATGLGIIDGYAASVAYSPSSISVQIPSYIFWSGTSYLLHNTALALRLWVSL